MSFRTAGSQWSRQRLVTIYPIFRPVSSSRPFENGQDLSWMTWPTGRGVRLVTAVCPPTTQIECTVRPVANVHPPTVWEGNGPGTRARTTCKARVRLISTRSNGSSSWDSPFSSAIPQGRSTATVLQNVPLRLRLKAVGYLGPCRSFYAVGTCCWVPFDCRNIDGCQRGYLLAAYSFAETERGHGGSAHRPFYNLEIVQWLA